MKKIILLIIISFLLTGCLPNKINENQTSQPPEKSQPTQTIKDSSLETIEKEINETQTEDFDKELNNLDTDINQLWDVGKASRR